MPRRQTNSEKLNFIDRSTFEKIQNDDVLAQKPRIRNSKYKKTHQEGQFSLLDFVKVQRKKQPGIRRVKKPKRVIDRRFAGPIIKPYGKTPAAGKKRHYTRLKKCILRYRKQKRREEHEAQTAQMQMLNIMMQDMSLQLHSRRFRSYCDNCTSARLRSLTELLLRDLDRFQKRAYAQNAIKAHAHRRMVLGFRETQNFLNINKVKCVIIAPDCELSPGDAGLDETIENIKRQCQTLEVPYLFSLRRRQLAYVLYKKVPVSCIAILDYDGCNALFAQLLFALAEARAEYRSTYKPSTQDFFRP